MTITHAILGCRKLSRVFTLRKPYTRHYVVCLDCGREFEYSLERMEIVRATGGKHENKTISGQTRQIR